MQEVLTMYFSKLPWLEEAIFAYIIYHTISYLLLSPILKYRFGLFITLMILPFSYFPMVKTCLKLSNWEMLDVLMDIGAGLGYILLPFFIGGLIYPQTFIICTILLLIVYVIIALGAIIFGFYYNFIIFKAMLFPTDEQLEKERLESEEQDKLLKLELENGR